MKRIFSFLLTLALVLALLPAFPPLTALAATSYNINTGNVAITTAGDYIITGTGAATANTITVNGGITANITLSNVSINVFTVAGACAFAITGGATVYLTLDGTNKLVSASDRAGLEVSGNNTVIIDGTGSLTATGNGDSAGIGGCANNAGGNITINGGTITATGGVSPLTSASGAGIGGGSGGAGGNITINGGTITATGSGAAYTGSAGIGGGSGGAGGNITINGGEITATGGNGNCGGAGIGGAYGGDGGNITINGGEITAHGGACSAGIGGGGVPGIGGGDGGNITITGGTIKATGGNGPGYGGAGIGGGAHGGDGGNITITGGEITATGAYGGAGIGGGYQGASGNIIITGNADVRAKGGNAYGLYGAGANVGGGGAGSNTTGTEEPAGTGGSGTYGDASTITTHSITITPPSNGTIAAYPSGVTGSVQVIDGASQTFKITPNPGYRTVSISIDGTVVAGETEYYTLTNVTTSHNISATFALNPPIITTDPGALTGGTFGVPYSETLAASTAAGTAIISWSIISGSLPGGLSISNGVISGTPDTAGTFNFVLTAANSAGSSEAVQFSITVANGPQAAPTGLGATDCTTAANNDGTITGVDATMQYSKDGGAYISISGTTLTGLAPGTYHVRYAAKTNYDAGADATVTIAAYSAAVTTVTVTGSYAATTGAGSYAQGETVTISAGTRSGYTFSGWTVTSGGVTLADASSVTTTFTMPANAVTVTANWNSNGGGGGGNDPTPTPTPSPSPEPGNTITINKAGELLKEGKSFTVEFDCATVTLGTDALEILAALELDGTTPITVEASVVPMKDLTGMQAAQVKGYETVVNIDVFVGDMKVDVPITVSIPYTLKQGENPAAVCVWHLDDAGNLTKLNGVYKDGAITFTVTHQSYFVVGYDPVALWVNVFSDVSEDDPYYDAIAFANYYGLLNGYGDGLSGANDTLSRAQMVTLLWNIEGKPSPNGAGRFTDVAKGSWYHDPVQWAAENGIVAGVGNGGFEPERAVTQQEMAVMLCNYARFKGYDIPENRDDFSDSGQISVWAESAAKALSQAGVMGNGGAFNPQDDATRADAAQALMAFLRFVAEELPPVGKE